MKDPDAAHNSTRRSWRAGASALFQSHPARLVGRWWSRRASVRRRGIAAAMGAAVLTSAGVLAIAPPAVAMNGTQPPTPGTELIAWGMNDNNQLGQGEGGSFDTPWSNVPIDVKPTWPNGTAFVDVSAGLSHALARTTPDGNVWAWGNNLYGQLGTTENQGSSQPSAIQVPNLSGVTDISGGAAHSLAVADGKALAWGNNALGQLGTGSTSAPDPTPKEVPGLQDVTAVSAAVGAFEPVSTSDGAGGHSLALTKQGEVYSWGLNNHGQLGRDGDTATPIQVTGLLAGKKVDAIVAGNTFSLALADGVVYGWGNNWGGTMGNNKYTQDVPAPVQIPVLSGVDRIAAGPYHAMAIAKGKVYTWGSNRYDQLGRDATALCAFSEACDPTPVQLTGDLGSLTATAIGGAWGGSVVLTSDGTAYGWGDESGDGSATSPTPVKVSGTGPDPATQVVAIAVGGVFAVAIASPVPSPQQPDVLDWGWNCDGQLGNHQSGEASNSTVPVQADLPANTEIIDIAGGYYHSIAATSGGHVYAWGNNNFGQIGQAPTANNNGVNVCKNNSPAGDDYIDHPVEVTSGSLNNVIQVAAGQSHSLALEKNGTVWAWGRNNSGQLGDGKPDDSPTPVQVLTNWGDDKTVIAIAARDQHSLALVQDTNNDTTVWAWGANDTAQLGNGHTGGISRVPTQVVGITEATGIKYIETGMGHSLAASDTTVYAWGYNNHGQLGNNHAGPSPAYNVPTAQKVNATWPANTTITTIAAGDYHSMAITSDGLYTWGANGHGQLGNSGTADGLVPGKISGSNLPGTVTAIAGGGLHSLAIADGILYAWGANNKGQLGDKTKLEVHKPTPVTMTDFPDVHPTQVAGGGMHSIAR